MEIESHDNARNELRKSGISEKNIDTLINSVNNLEICCDKVIAYTEYGDEIVNQGYRSGIMSFYGHQLSDVIYEAYVNSETLAKSLMIYRGVEDYDNNKYEDMKFGQVIYNKGFSSFSVSKNEAMLFAGDEGYLIKMKLPEGEKVVYVGNETLSYSPDEMEVIVRPGLTMQVISKDSSKRPKEITCKFIGYDDKNSVYTINKQLDISYLNLAKQLFLDDNYYMIDNGFLLVPSFFVRQIDKVVFKYNYRDRVLDSIDNEEISFEEREDDAFISIFRYFITNNLKISQILNIDNIFKFINDKTKNINVVVDDGDRYNVNVVRDLDKIIESLLKREIETYDGILVDYVDIFT